MDKSTKDKFQYALAVLLVSGFFGLLVMIVFVTVPSENSAAFNLLLGSLSTAVGTVVGYFFGSSKGSSEKNDIIAGNIESK